MIWALKGLYYMAMGQQTLSSYEGGLVNCCCYQVILPMKDLYNSIFLLLQDNRKAK